ncbi:MAG: 5-(carboxyamino)imidazole ribonucleotide synthase [Anaplasma sp.]
MLQSHSHVGAVVGIMGGGQLGKMTSLAASKMGYRTHVFAERHDDPAVFVTNMATIAGFDDHAKLSEFASSIDLAIIEFENIPIEAVDAVLSKVPVHPGKKALYIAQNRVREKKHISDLGVPVANFAAVSSHAELCCALADMGYPSLLKTAELGYDGRGQYAIRSASDIEKLSELDWKRGYILEKFVEVEDEISLIVAVAEDRTYVLFPPARNRHINGILDESTVPAGVESSLVRQAEEIAVTIALSLEVTGILAVEFFITSRGELLVNEIAPRPHNSGHWSIDACNVSQFEQLVRAACGLPLREVQLLAPCTTKNIFGDTSSIYQTYTDPRSSVSIYGKRKPSSNRKMGHVNVLEY